MRTKTIISAGLLALSTAALAQVATSTDPKLGNGPNPRPANAAAATDNAADPAGDPGKP